MIIAVDIGNSRTKFGTKNNSWFINNNYQNAEQLRTEISSFINLPDVEGVSLSSVVPELTKFWEELFSDVYMLDINNKLFKTIFSNVEEIAPDIVAGVIGANTEYGYPCIVLDTGTATTLSVINKNGEFMGGCIIPGIETSFHSLINDASLLEDIKLKYPDKAIGSTTKETLRSGTIMGEVFRIDGLIKKIESELGYPTKVIATGGWSKVISKHLEHPCIYDSDLLLKGLFKAYEA